jgi:hypothetical protein
VFPEHFQAEFSEVASKPTVRPGCFFPSFLVEPKFCLSGLRSPGRGHSAELPARPRWGQATSEIRYQSTARRPREGRAQAS